MTTVAVLGCGAIGTYFGAHVAKANDVIACGRTRLDRLVVDLGENRLEVAVRAATDPRAVQSVEWVLLAVKAHQTDTVGAWLGRLCAPSSHVLVLQNGIDHEERVAPYVNNAIVVPAVVQTGVERVGPGHTVVTVEGRVLVPDDHGGKAAAMLLAAAGIDVAAVANFRTASWRKLCSNSAANALTAITLRPSHVIGERADLAALAHQLITEAMAVAAADGCPQEPDLADALVARYIQADPRVRSSTLQDREAGRPLEYEALNGAVVRAGARLGVPTPMQQVMRALLGAISGAADDSKGRRS